MSALRAGLIHWYVGVFLSPLQAIQGSRSLPQGPSSADVIHARDGAFSLHGLAKARQQGSGRRVGLPPGAKQYIREVRRVLSYLTKHDYAGFPPQVGCPRHSVILRLGQ